MWIISKAASTGFVLLFVGAIIFALTRLAPVSPAQVVLGMDASKEQIAAFEAQHGLNAGVLTQYGRWLAALPSEGFGRSYATNQSVNDEVAEKLPVTLEIVVVAFVIAVVGSIVTGSAAALYEDTAIDHAIRLFGVLALSMPAFWLGLLLIRLFSVELDWLPPYGITPVEDGIGAHLASLLLPAVSIAIYYIGAMSRLLRASFIEVLGADYMRTAKACGLKPLRRAAYALKNALPPYVSMAAMSFGYMFGWAVVIELVFNIPGLSRALLTAILQRDYPMIQAAVLVVTIVFVASTALADVLLRILNPRIAR
jgi:peptide/nickel transport system permease protein